MMLMLNYAKSIFRSGTSMWPLKYINVSMAPGRGFCSTHGEFSTSMCPEWESILNCGGSPSRGLVLALLQSKTRSELEVRSPSKAIHMYALYIPFDACSKYISI